MTKEITPEQLIQELNKLKMTPEERMNVEARELGRTIGKYTAGIIILFLAPTIIWASLVFLIGLNVAWVKVFGAYFIFNFIKNLIIRSAKSASV
jgi:hypothetical protein